MTCAAVAVLQTTGVILPRVLRLRNRRWEETLVLLRVVLVVDPV